MNARQLIENEGDSDELKREALDSLEIEHEFRDRGIDNAQYFQGAGVAGTDWKECFIGAGDNYKEAAEDALEQAASSFTAWNVESIDTSEFPTKPSVMDVVRQEARGQVAEEILNSGDEEAISAAIDEIIENDDSGNELYYYVVLYLK